MYQVRVQIPDDRLRAAIEAHRETILGCHWAKIVSMEPDELRDIVANLVVTMLADEIEWLDARRLACTIRVTEDEHVFLIDFVDRAAALLFQSVWGGEIQDEMALPLMQ